MKLSEDRLKQFHELYFTHLGVHLDTQEAEEKAYKLLRFIQLIYQPMTEEKFMLLKNFLEKNGILHHE